MDNKPPRRGLLSAHALLLAALLVGAVAPVLVYELGSRHHERPDVQMGGPFTLNDGDGHTVTDRTYRGKWMLVYFGYTFCPDVCPTTLSDIASALAKLGSRAADVAPLFITVDPERDTAPVMREYVRAFDSRIIGLTGTPAQVAAVARKYHVFYQKADNGTQGNDYLVDHSALIYVIDPSGQFAAYFSHGTTSDAIASGLKQLMD